MRQARIVPEQENGKMVAFASSVFVPTTLLGVLGMENGDRLQTINGFDHDEPGEGARGVRAFANGRPPDGSSEPEGAEHEPRLQHPVTATPGGETQARRESERKTMEGEPIRKRRCTRWR